MTENALAPFHFPRPDLARGYVDALVGRSGFGLGGCLFLAAPRRTGKSTFLRADLTPQLQAEPAEVLYVDLWSDPDADPAELIAERVAQAMMAEKSVLKRLTDGAGLQAIKIGPFTLRIGGTGDSERRAVTLADALSAYADAVGRPVALLVDEAQHALNSETGRDAMFALKAARDAMNIAGQPPRLLLVFTGSHRDKLMTLVDGRDQPFYGSTVLDLPVLGQDYVAAYVARINAPFAEQNRFDPVDVGRAFALVGHRPELLQQVMAEHALGGIGPQNLGQSLTERAGYFRQKLWAQYESDHGRLTGLQAAVLAQLVADGDAFAPFTNATIQAVAKRMGDKVTTSNMQSALDALREKGLVWRAGRGRYALEDQGIADWLASLA